MLRAASEARLRGVSTKEARGVSLGDTSSAEPLSSPARAGLAEERQRLSSPVRAELAEERQRRVLAEAKLAAVRCACSRLQQENETLTARLAVTTQRLRNTARARDDLRSALASTKRLESAMAGALAQKHCVALTERLRLLETELAALRASSGIPSRHAGSRKAAVHHAPFTMD